LNANTKLSQRVLENALQTARIQTVIDFMNANLHRKIPLPELAEIASLSTSHLSRLFNLQTGLSPGDYLIKLRMEKARHLLVTSFLSIKQVMATLGYDTRSRANFVDQFKRYFDRTPSEYRKLFFTGSIEDRASVTKSKIR
jgi:transcriptional regulator GlxA family with amidase domain